MDRHKSHKEIGDDAVLQQRLAVAVAVAVGFGRRWSRLLFNGAHHVGRCRREIWI